LRVCGSGDVLGFLPFGLLFLLALDHGDLVVVVEVDDLLPEHSPFVLQPFELLAALPRLSFLLANGNQSLPELPDLALDVVQRLIRSEHLLVALLPLVVRLLPRLHASLLRLLLLDALLGCFFHQ
jgi:hypothetical protein